MTDICFPGGNSYVEGGLCGIIVDWGPFPLQILTLKSPEMFQSGVGNLLLNVST